ncbi:TMEM175 family protein [Arthrobacter sp. ISL-72]|uniref:TMEM175 family protein n=1 Tax=Arthrobacter sp. ISL-72 TaxID=2819114 RepID=UPI002034D35C|nr:TMEM175 family protein [Arthrobacter sp. ISL-72]
MESGTPLERMVFFSDAVFAIALTLLALDLKLPEGIAAAQLDGALIGAVPELFAYALSFVIIAKTWLSHHSDFALIRRFNSTLAWLNLALLFFIAMLPAPTSVLSEYGDDSTPWPSILYAQHCRDLPAAGWDLGLRPAREAHGSGDGFACAPADIYRPRRCTGGLPAQHSGRVPP